MSDIENILPQPPTEARIKETPYQKGDVVWYLQGGKYSERSRCPILISAQVYGIKASWRARLEARPEAACSPLVAGNDRAMKSCTYRRDLTSRRC